MMRLAVFSLRSFHWKFQRSLESFVRRRSVNAHLSFRFVLRRGVSFESVCTTFVPEDFALRRVLGRVALMTSGDGDVVEGRKVSTGLHLPTRFVPIPQYPFR